MSQLPPNSPLQYATPGSYEPPKKPIRFRNGLFGWLVFIGLAVMLIFLLQNTKKARADLSLDQFHSHLLAGDVVSMTVGTGNITGVLRAPVTLPSTGTSVRFFQTSLPTGTTGNWAFTEWLLESRNGARIDVSNDSGLLTTVIMPLIPWVLIFGFIWFFVFRNLRKAGKAKPASLTLPAGPIEVIVVNRDSK